MTTIQAPAALEPEPPVADQAVQVVEVNTEPAPIQEQAAADPSTDLQKLNFSPEQLSYLRQLSNNSADVAQASTIPSVDAPEIEQAPVDKVEQD